MRYSSCKRIIKNYFLKNIKEYILVSLLFLIGIFIGVMIINNINESQISEIKDFVKEFIEKYKEVGNINSIGLFVQSIKKNLIFAFILWIAGTTIIGMPIVLISILIRGTILGFTISTISITLGKTNGILFCISSLLLHNLIYIPTVLTIGVSSIKLYKSIIKDKRRENIKLEILRHTIISFFMIILLVLSAIIENFASFKMLKKTIKYF